MTQALASQRSDLGLLVERPPETTLFDIGAIRHELKQLLGIEVGVWTPACIPEASRAQLLREAEPV